MGQIEDLRTFLNVVDHGSISKAAAQMGIAKSAVSRRMSLLEARYDAILIDRAPGIWALTKTGQELYERAVQVVTEVDEIETDFVNTSASISGPLNISVPREFGISYLNNVLLAFKVKYPQIQLTIDFDDRTVDLDRENYDFALRITSDLNHISNAVQIGSVEHHLYASPEYLRKKGTPECLKELHDHNLLYFGKARRTVWEFNNGKGKTQNVAFHPYMNSNSGMFLLDATEQGLGISRLPSFITSQSLERGEIVKVMTDFTIPQWGIFLVHSEKRTLNRRMRVFFEMMQQACLQSQNPDRVGINQY